MLQNHGHAAKLLEIQSILFKPKEKERYIVDKIV